MVYCLCLSFAPIKCRCCLARLFYNMIIYILIWITCILSAPEWWWSMYHVFMLWCCVWFALEWMDRCVYVCVWFGRELDSKCLRLCSFSHCVWFNWEWRVVFVIGSIKGGWCMPWSTINLTSHSILNAIILLVNGLHASGFCHFHKL